MRSFWPLLLLALGCDRVTVLPSMPAHAPPPDDGMAYTANRRDPGANEAYMNSRCPNGYAVVDEETHCGRRSGCRTDVLFRCTDYASR